MMLILKNQVDLVLLMDYYKLMINVHDAKTQFSKLLDRAQRGEEIVISRGGNPVAKLVPIGVAAPRTAGLLSGTVPKEFFDELPAAEMEGWEKP